MFWDDQYKDTNMNNKDRLVLTVECGVCKWSGLMARTYDGPDGSGIKTHSNYFEKILENLVF